MDNRRLMAVLEEVPEKELRIWNLLKQATNTDGTVNHTFFSENPEMKGLIDRAEAEAKSYIRATAELRGDITKRHFRER